MLEIKTKSILIRLVVAAALTVLTVALASAAQSQQADEDPSPNSAHPQQKPNTIPSQRPGSAEQPSAEPHTQEVLAFTGIVTRDKNNEITLNDPVTRLVYKFDDTAKAEPYLGKKVKVVGKLGMSSNTIQIATIEAIPDAVKP